MLAAASKKSGITNLRQIEGRKQPTWIEAGNDTDLIFNYYGINPESLKAKGGGVIRSIVGGTREHRATADVFMGTGLMANTPEQGWWNEASQLNDLVFLDIDEPLIAKLAQEPGYERATVPKRFVLVEGGSHHDTHVIGHALYREAMRELFGLPV